MAALSNNQHEKFCWEYIKLRDNGKQAYLAVYGQVKGAAQNAVKLLQKPDIQARLAEIRAATAKRNEVSVDSLVAELDEVIAFAKTDPKQSSARVNAITAKAKITGNWVDKVEHRVESMSDAELAEAIQSEQTGSAIPWGKVLEKSRGGTAADPRSNGKDKPPPAAPTES